MPVRVAEVLAAVNNDDQSLLRMDAPLPFLRHSCYFTAALLLLLSHSLISQSSSLQSGCWGRLGEWLERTGS